MGMGSASAGERVVLGNDVRRGLKVVVRSELGFGF